MLETPEERVKLLKAGFIGRTIEKLYIKYNNIKIVNIPAIIELLEFDIPQTKETCIGCEVTVECAQSYCEEGAFLC